MLHCIFEIYKDNKKKGEKRHATKDLCLFFLYTCPLLLSIYFMGICATEQAVINLRVVACGRVTCEYVMRLLVCTCFLMGEPGMWDGHI